MQDFATRHRKARWTKLAAALAGAVMSSWAAWPAHAQQTLDAQQSRGEYLAAAGDCASCHTTDKGAYAGGRPLETPFGTIYAPNITPDRETGIGGWSDDQFYHAMHDGISADGSHLYPAFPYPWFTKFSREDVDAIHAYLRTIPAVKNQAPPNKLPWPLSIRAAMIGWNALFFKPGNFVPDSSKSAEWNRGAYLVEGAGHCSACHTPVNMVGAPQESKAYQGGELDHWFAPNLTSDTKTGLGGWSAQDIAQFLKTGQTDRTYAYGPMAEVVDNSTSKMTDADLAAIATYLKSIPAAGPAASSDRPSQEVVQAGRTIYEGSCSSCHESDGTGGDGPSLKGSGIVQSENPTTVIRLVLSGDDADTSDRAMPSFGPKLSDSDAAAVISYIRSAWGNTAPPVSGDDVKKLRDVVTASGGNP